MPTKFIDPMGRRHRLEIVAGIEQIRIPTARNWITIPFMMIWLTGWTVGGIHALSQLSQSFDLFLLVWLVFWAGGWIMVGSWLLMQINGSETLRVTGGNLEIRSGFGPFVRAWHYRGREICNLTSNIPSSPFGWSANGLERPFFMRPKTGAIRFDHGAATIYMAAGLDEPEGREIVAWLAPRLPRSASDGC